MKPYVFAIKPYRERLTERKRSQRKENKLEAKGVLSDEKHLISYALSLSSLFSLLSLSFSVSTSDTAVSGS